MDAVENAMVPVEASGLLEEADPHNAPVEVDADWVSQCHRVPFVGCCLGARGERARSSMLDNRDRRVRPVEGYG
jgi:hypothetical protein